MFALDSKNTKQKGGQNENKREDRTCAKLQVRRHHPANDPHAPYRLFLIGRDGNRLPQGR